MSGVLAAACARRVEPVVPEAGAGDLGGSEGDWESAVEELSTSHADVLADLDVVERVMRGGWATFEVREREGVDWKAVFSALREGVAALPEPVPADALRRYLAHGLDAARDPQLSF